MSISHHHHHQSRSTSISRRCCIDTSAAEYTLGPFTIPNRFFALFAFCVMAITNGFSWFEFDPIASQVKATFQGYADDTTISLLSTWQPLMFLLLFVPMTMIITKQDGLRKALRIGATAAFCGGIIKIMGATMLNGSYGGILCLHVGQILIAISAPSVIGGVSSLAAQFFPPDERARATAAAILCNDLGGAVGYLLSPTMAKSAAGIAAVIGFELVMVTCLLFMTWVVFPDAPRRRAALEAMPEDAAAGFELHNSNSSVGITHKNHNLQHGGAANHTANGATTSIAIAAKESDFTSHITFKAQLQQVLTEPTPIMIMIVFSWCSGGFVAWTSMFEIMMDGKYDSAVVGTISFTASVCYVAGGLIAGYLIDKYFHHHMSAFISFSLAVACVGTTVFTALVPTVHDEEAVLELESPMITFVFAGISGLGFGAATPIFFELLADYSYPVDEAISGGLLSMMEAVGALVIYQLVARFMKGGGMNYAFSGGCALCLLLSTFVDEQHNRPASGDLEGASGDSSSYDDDDDDLNDTSMASFHPKTSGGRGNTNAGAEEDDEELSETTNGGGGIPLAGSGTRAPSTLVRTEEQLEALRAKKRALLIEKKKKELIAAKKQQILRERREAAAANNNSSGGGVGGGLGDSGAPAAIHGSNHQSVSGGSAWDASTSSGTPLTGGGNYDSQTASATVPMTEVDA